MLKFCRPILKYHDAYLKKWMLPILETLTDVVGSDSYPLDCDEIQMTDYLILKTLFVFAFFIIGFTMIISSFGQLLSTAR